VSLEEVASETKISERFLKAIEADNFEALPGVIFARNFVRQYAAMLGLDPAPLVAALPSFDLETAPLPVASARSRRSRWDPRWNSAFASVAWTLIAGGAAVAAYIHFSRPAHFNRPAHPVRMEAAAPVAQTASAPPQAIAAPVTGAKAPAAASDGSPVHLVVSAREDSWVQVTSDGKNSFSGILRANESRSFDARELIKVIAGNAGGIELALNGKTLDPLGPAGQVRSIRLTAEGPLPKSPMPSPDPI
jgi:cytoskeletal protein RodZ